MKQFWTTKEFKELEKSWYKKLQKKGFTDSEKTVGTKRVLITASKTMTENNGTEEYFRQLLKHSFEAKYDSPTHKAVMRRRALGWMIKDIAAGLKPPMHRKSIRDIIHKYEDRWGIRKWNHRIK